MPDLGESRAVVTGASAGLGEAMARQLATWRCSLVLVARRRDRLEKLAAELTEAHGVAVECVALDLTEPGAAQRLIDAAYAGGAEVDILINNAGFGYYRDFLDGDLDRYRELMQLNMHVLVELTHGFAARMRARGRRAHIGNISSMVAYFALPGMAVYASTKAFVRNFTEAFAIELAGTPVSATCVSLGAVSTEFYDVSGIKIGALYRRFVMSAPRAARIALRGILRGRRNILPGVLNKIAALLTWLAPRRLSAWVLRSMLGKPRAALREGKEEAIAG